MFTEMIQEVNKVCVFHPSRGICPSSAARWPVDQEMIAAVDTGENKVWRYILFPVAETTQASVTRVPLSAEVSDPICLNPCLANTLSGLCTVVTPVSSTFQMSPGPNSYLHKTFS